MLVRPLTRRTDGRTGSLLPPAPAACRPPRSRRRPIFSPIGNNTMHSCVSISPRPSAALLNERNASATAVRPSPLPIAATASDVTVLNPAFDSRYALERATMRRPTQQRPIRSLHSVFCSKSATIHPPLPSLPSRLSFPPSPIKPSLETLQTREGHRPPSLLPSPTYIIFASFSFSRSLCILSSVSFFPSRARCPSSFSPLGTIIIIG